MTGKPLYGALAPAHREHQLQRLPNGDYICDVCEWQWNKKPLPQWDCPEVKRYGWDTAPRYLKTAKQLHRRGLRPTKRRGCYVDLMNQTHYLYDIREARPEANREARRPRAFLFPQARKEKDHDNAN